MNLIEELYSTDERDLFIDYIKAGKSSLKDLLEESDSPRFAANKYSKEAFYSLIDKYSNLPDHPEDPSAGLQTITSDLFVGVPRWKSPRLLYNVGTAVNEAAAAAYALGLEENVYNINDGLAGNTLVAEHAVVNIVSQLAGISTKPYGIFTFGGTATNLYGMKLGLKKALPDSSHNGVEENVRVFVTEDAHFSHNAAADWLGIGTKRVVTIRAQQDRTSDLSDLEKQLRSALAEGSKLGTIIINGGTTYDHAIDDIAAVAELRDRLVEEFNLPYKPHIHVDAVIGWSWLFFKNYDWRGNPLELEANVLEKIRRQYERIKEIHRADSWGIDFHKGIGGCPIACSLVVINNFEDAMLLSRKASSGVDIHQLAAEYSFASPVDYTLETSRASGAPLAALTALHTLGSFGYQRNLANLIDQTTYMRERLMARGHLQTTNDQSWGFVTAIRLVPSDLQVVTSSEEFADSSQTMREKSDLITDYTKKFFTWDYETRMKEGRGPEYSYSSGYATTPSGAKLGIIKLYPVSPYFDQSYAEQVVDTIVKQQAVFDSKMWAKK